MAEALISTTMFGLKKSDVDNYILKLTNSYKDKLSELIKEKKLLERAKQKLLIELSNIRTDSVIYEDVVEEKHNSILGKTAEESFANADKTIILINELADQKIEQMISRAKNQVAEYDRVLEGLSDEMEENRQRIEQLLSDVEIGRAHV